MNPSHIKKGITLQQIKDGLCITQMHGAHCVFPDENKKRKRTKIRKNDYVTFEEHFFLGNKNGKILHCINGPAQIVHKNHVPNKTFVHYFYNGFEINNTYEYCYLCGFDDIETTLWILKYGEELPSLIEGDFYDVE